MAFTFATGCLIDEPTFSQLVYGVTDGSATLTSIQKAQVEFCVNAANSKILSYLDRDILQATYTEVWDCNGSDELIPKQYPVSSVTSIKIAANNAFNTATALDSTSYYVNAESISFHGNILPQGRAVVQVVYVAGYPIASIPYDLKYALILQFKMDYNLINAGVVDPNQSLLYSGASKMGESFTKNKTFDQNGLAKEVTAILDGYTRMDAPLSVMFARVQ